MHVISRAVILKAANRHPQYSDALDGWYRIIKSGRFATFADLKRTFNSVDKVGDYCVFNVAGNHMRVVAAVHFKRGEVLHPACSVSLGIRQVDAEVGTGDTKVSAIPQDIAGDVIEHWQHIAPVLGRPDSEEDYARLVDLLNTVLDRGGADENHPLAGLAALIGDLLGAYEADSVPEPNGSPNDVLRFLMEQHGLTQSELPEIGNQSVVSQVLSGKRQLNLRQVAALSKRFGVSADALVK